FCHSRVKWIIHTKEVLLSSSRNDPHFLLPFADDRNVPSLSERPKAAVYLAGGPHAIAVEVQLPEACVGIKDPDPGYPRPVPVPGHGPVPRDAKRTPTAVHLAAAPHAIAVKVQLPEACAGTKDPNPGCPRPTPAPANARDPS